MFLLTRVITNAISLNEQAVNSWYIFSCTANTLPDTKSLLPKKIARIITKICRFFKPNSFFIDKNSCQRVKNSASMSLLVAKSHFERMQAFQNVTKFTFRKF